MRNALRTLITVTFVALVGAGLTFGTAQAFSPTPAPSTTVAQECGDAPWELGFCEDNGWSNSDCRDACQDAGFTSGGCSPWDGTTKTCCICTS
jgi:hypothetical protein